MEDRLHDLERDNAETRERLARLEATLEAHVQVTTQLTTAVADLTRTLNKGKGAAAVIGSLGVMVGAVSHWVLEVFHRSG